MRWFCQNSPKKFFLIEAGGNNSKGYETNLEKLGEKIKRRDLPFQLPKH